MSVCRMMRICVLIYALGQRRIGRVEVGHQIRVRCAGRRASGKSLTCGVVILIHQKLDVLHKAAHTERRAEAVLEQHAPSDQEGRQLT